MGVSIQHQIIEALDSDGKVVHTFATQAEVVQRGFCQQSVSECLLGNRQTHKGLRWRRAIPGGATPGVASQISCGWWIPSKVTELLPSLSKLVAGLDIE